MDEAKSRGWTDRELLSSLLYLVQKNNITFDWNDGIYPAGRNASGFRQKINILKRTLKPEWDAMASGAPSTPSTPKKTPATPRKRKPEADKEGSAKKSRAQPSKATPSQTILTLSGGEDDEEMGFNVKSEPKEEKIEDDNGDLGAFWEF